MADLISLIAGLDQYALAALAVSVLLRGLLLLVFPKHTADIAVKLAKMKTGKMRILGLVSATIGIIALYIAAA
ncbi:MAG: DUF2065 family protein [Candidatus Aenigmatarchaeota archaeon]